MKYIIEFGIRGPASATLWRKPIGPEMFSERVIAYSS